MAHTDVSCLCACLQHLEEQYSGADVVLVAHGDTLSILHATLQGTELSQHRHYGLETAGYAKMA
jgi:broad specificity phosphatase PhoE